ncbi:MAG: citrate lyase acyl carrier protein [Clostridia bacterium]|nr:citrate lyase acyl carrier protein [Clostridia bacterium]
MSDIIKRASAGTMESSDAYIEISPADKGLEISLDSVVQQQFGEAIEKVVLEVLTDCGVQNAKVNVIDKGALDCVIRARVETAVMRGRGE